MSESPLKAAIFCAVFLFFSPNLYAKSGGNCPDAREPEISFIDYPSIDNPLLPPEQQTEITVKGKLKMPQRCNRKQRDHRPLHQLTAVLILHGSAGVDFRGDFYASALNDAGIATLEIDLWEARGVTGVANRPPLPVMTYPDAFGGLEFLSAHEMIDPGRIGVLGFSWGGVMSLASAEQTYAGWFGQGLRFAAHAAHYPVCYGANNDDILAAFGVDSTIAGTRFKNLTGAPVLIQIGTEDDYDNGAEPCLSIADDLTEPSDRTLVDVAVYEGAYHAWDRLQVPSLAADPFGDQGSYLLGQTATVPTIEVIPNVDQAYEARLEIVDFFRRNL
jgi:dienelactone hydrolase